MRPDNPYSGPDVLAKRMGKADRIPQPDCNPGPSGSGSSPHPSTTGGESGKVPQVEEVRGKSSMHAAHGTSTPNGNSSTLDPPTKYDRNEAHRAYMREYMRKRRVALKERAK